MHGVAACRLAHARRDGHLADGAREPRAASVGRPRPELGRRLVTDELAPAVGIGRREELVHGHVDEVRVAVPRLAIGERELRALGHRVHVLGARMAEGGEIESFEQAELLEEHGRLAPRTCLEHGQAVVVDREGLLVRRPPVAEILLREQPRVPLARAVHPLLGLEAQEGVGDTRHRAPTRSGRRGPTSSPPPRPRCACTWQRASGCGAALPARAPGGTPAPTTSTRLEREPRRSGCLARSARSPDSPPPHSRSRTARRRARRSSRGRAAA